VTERDWRHLWLSEGFASYFDLVFAAALGDDSALARGMRAEARGYLASNVVDRPLVDATAEDLMGLLNANSYNKGAWVLHMLRGEVGDSAFFRGIRRYYAAFRDSSVLSEDFARAMERAAGRDLRWFFRQWLYQPGYPRLDVTWRTDAAGRRVTLRVRQAQSAAWGRFRLPRVAVRFTGAGGAADERTIALDPARAEQAFAFTLPRASAGLAVDPEGRLLLTAEVRKVP
jgi:aminopeptidase N